MASAPEMSSRQRLERALVASARQEFSAPVAAILGFAEILLEDIRHNGLDAFIRDIEHIRHAGLRLQGLLDDMLNGARVPAAGEDYAAFCANMDHDLRSPLSAVKGYGEMVLEDATESGDQAFIHDVRKLLSAADELLARIDAVGVAGSLHPGRPLVEGPVTPDALSIHLVTGVLDTIRPLSVEDEPEPTLPSRILIVDDIASNRDLLARRLIREGHLVETVADGGAALTRLVEAAPGFDLVLLDLMLPDVSGFEVLHRIKTDPGTRRIPVIMISALDEFDSLVRCIQAGAEDYLSKPLNEVLLRARINASLEKKWLRDREHTVTEQLRAEQKKSEALLLNILPKPIIGRLRQGESEITDRFDEVTIVFSDIVGFTAMASRLPPNRLIEILNRVFSEYDAVAAEFGLEKIKTIGDAYMAAAGVPEPRDDHAIAATSMALRMIEVGKAAGERLGEKLQIRVGIHTGAAIGGIIGRHRFIYDVWGDTVNTASRMESHGVPDRIHLSEETYRHIHQHYNCESRGRLEIKGKGAMETYLLGH